MTTIFNRGLSKAFLELLKAAAQSAVWLQDILADPTLVIGVRGDCLNVYWLGQSLFNITLVGDRFRVTTHEKYLLDPSLSGQVELVGEAFQIEKLLRSGFLSSYEGASSLAKMKRTARYYAGSEKRGVHEVVIRNPAVIDVEIAFPGTVSLDDGKDDKQDPRVDIAALEEDDERVRLVFWEAKTYANGELRAMGDDVPVVRQMSIYEKFLTENRAAVEESYRKVAANLLALEAAGWRRPIADAVRRVGDGSKQLTLDEVPRIGLLVFGFDAAQRDSQIWKSHRAKLEARGVEVRAAGNPRNIRL